MKKKKKSKIIFGIEAFLIVIIAAFLIWAGQYYKPMPEAASSISTDGSVTVENGKYIVFSPSAEKSTTGVIIYPGGKVAPEAYAPLARNIALNGYKVFIVPMPLNLAVLAPSKAKKVIEDNRDITAWIIAGHSLGGSMACKFAYDNPGVIKGIILLASYPAGSDSLTDKQIKVLSVYGTNDGFVGSGKIEETKKLLPGDTIYKSINGGNHSQMAYYGFQKGDNEASISREEQQKEVLQDIKEFIDDIKK